MERRDAGAVGKVDPRTPERTMAWLVNPGLRTPGPDRRRLTLGIPLVDWPLSISKPMNNFAAPDGDDPREAGQPTHGGSPDLHLCPVRHARACSNRQDRGQALFRSRSIRRGGRNRKSARSAKDIVSETRSPRAQLTSNPDEANTRNPRTSTTVVVKSA